MSVVLEYIKDFAGKYLSVPNLYVSDIVEIIVIAIMVYYIILWFRKSKAWFLLNGIFVILVIVLVASLFNLTTLSWLINRALSVGIIALVVIFQPELRNALEELGKGNVLFKFLKIDNGSSNERLSDYSAEELTRATLSMSKAKTGALIVIKQEYDLSKYIETGIRLDAKITSQLLINIFEKNTPLHDGAVIIDGNEIVAATCYLPLSDSASISKDLGTRHRAGLGVSEQADCLVIIVSEETGSISVAREGKLIRYATTAVLKNELVKAQAKKEETKKQKKSKKAKKRSRKGRDGHEKHDDQTEENADK